MSVRGLDRLVKREKYEGQTSRLTVPLSGTGNETGDNWVATKQCARFVATVVACVPSSPHLSELINEGLPLPQLVIVPEGSLKQS